MFLSSIRLQTGDSLTEEWVKMFKVWSAAAPCCLWP